MNSEMGIDTAKERPHQNDKSGPEGIETNCSDKVDTLEPLNDPKTLKRAINKEQCSMEIASNESNPKHMKCTANAIQVIDITSDGSDNENLTDFMNKKRKKYDEHEQFGKKLKYSENCNFGRLFPTVAKRTYKKVVYALESFATFEDVGGMDKTLKYLCEVMMRIKCSDIDFDMGPPFGILLHGPQGCGKRLLAYAIAGQLKLPFIEVLAFELISGVSGESEHKIRDVFHQALICAPCVLFINDIDAIGKARSFAKSDMECHILAQLIACLDNLYLKAYDKTILVVGSTTRLENLDPALRRVGRFEHEVPINIPNREGRKDIFNLLIRELNMDPNLNSDKLAEWTPGYVSADLLGLAKRASLIAFNRKNADEMRILQSNAELRVDTLIPDDEGVDQDNKTKAPLVVNDNNNNMNVEDEQQQQVEKNENEIDEPLVGISKISKQNVLLEEFNLNVLLHQLENLNKAQNIENYFCVTLSDFELALKQFKPAARLEGFVTVPNVTWNDVGSLQNIREELKLAILVPIRYPERLKRLGLKAPSGVLLCGPPGCGKTLLANAIANEAGINFISVKGPELMCMYVGESERAVRECFQRARISAPCVIFFDEFDSLCPKRSSSGVGTCILNQFLTEMDCIEERENIYILAATNRPDIIDSAILHPGRLDKILYVGLPEFEDRIDIIKVTTKNCTCPLFNDDVVIEDLAQHTNGFTGADIAGLVRQASMLALNESLNKPEQSDAEISVAKHHFDKALSMFRPSVTAQDHEIYENLRNKLSTSDA